MTIEEIIQRIQSLYSKGVQSDDSRLKPRHIYNKLLSARSAVLTMIAKTQGLSTFNYQELPCVELVEVEPGLCSCLPSNCTIKRTKYRIPTLLYTGRYSAIKSVSSIDGSVLFSETSFDKLGFIKGNRYTKQNPFWYERDGYIYVENRFGIDVISLIGLFSDPFEANLFPSYCGNDETDCISVQEFEFPIDPAYIEDIIKLALAELVGLFSQAIEDTTNDTKDSESPQNENV